jgi:hypothetical protein
MMSYQEMRLLVFDEETVNLTSFIGLINPRNGCRRRARRWTPRSSRLARRTERRLAAAPRMLFILQPGAVHEVRSSAQLVQSGLRDAGPAH